MGKRDNRHDWICSAPFLIDLGWGVPPFSLRCLSGRLFPRPSTLLRRVLQSPRGPPPPFSTFFDKRIARTHRRFSLLNASAYALDDGGRKPLFPPASYIGVHLVPARRGPSLWQLPRGRCLPPPPSVLVTASLYVLFFSFPMQAKSWAHFAYFDSSRRIFSGGRTRRFPAPFLWE